MNTDPEKIELPPHVPVMFLPSVVLLPHVLLPLFIFEPRYRTMLTHALEQQRMFCVALLQPGVEEVQGRRDFHPTCGLGLVRACVGHEDGTSHLILQGLARVELGPFIQEKPFRIAKVSQLPEQAAPDGTGLRLATELRQLCTELAPSGEGNREKLEEQIGQISDPAMLADVVAHTFLRDAQRQQQVLDELEVEERLRLVMRHLREESPT